MAAEDDGSRDRAADYDGEGRERAVSEHLDIGIAALDVLKGQSGTAHSRKLRSFDEPPFR